LTPLRKQEPLKKQEPSRKKKPNITIQELEEKIPAKVTSSAGKDDYQMEVEDIPTVIKRIETVEQSHPYDEEYRPVPGGCQINSDETPSWGTGTLGTPVNQPNSSNDAWVTAAHVAGDVDRGDSVTADIHQPNESDDTIGTAYSWDWWYPSTDQLDQFPADAAVITSDWADDSKFDIACDGSGCSGYEGQEIKGRVGWDRIKIIEGTLDHTLQGNATGRNSGVITGTDKPSYQINVDSSPGDSGGPYYESPLHDDGIYIGGIHNSGWGDTAECTAMEFIENELDIYVGGSFG